MNIPIFIDHIISKGALYPIFKKLTKSHFNKQMIQVPVASYSCISDLFDWVINNDHFN